jgi:hypothetical protein
VAGAWEGGRGTDARLRVPARGRLREESGGSRLRSPAARGCVLRRIKAALRVRVFGERGTTQTRVWRRRVEEKGLRAFGTGCCYEPVLKVFNS